MALERLEKGLRNTFPDGDRTQKQQKNDKVVGAKFCPYRDQERKNEEMTRW